MIENARFELPRRSFCSGPGAFGNSALVNLAFDKSSSAIWFRFHEPKGHTVGAALHVIGHGSTLGKTMIERFDGVVEPGLIGMEPADAFTTLARPL